MCCVQADPLTQVGEEIELVSNDPKSKNSLKNLAEQSGMIVYEILVNLDKSEEKLINI
jgi:alanine racemase